jgi:hypothetical protein
MIAKIIGSLGRRDDGVGWVPATEEQRSQRDEDQARAVKIGVTRY